MNVRSDGAVKMFEKALNKGPLTLVYINAKWCGACHRFNDEVWNHLTKLKNKSVNLASVDSEYIGKTSLANVPRKFYPTLMLVGKDKKPATFEDEDGMPTNAMPRNNTLSEDREALSNLVQNAVTPTSLSMSKNSTGNVSVPVNTLARSNTTKKSLARSPFESINGMPSMPSTMPSMSSAVSSTISSAISTSKNSATLESDLKEPARTVSTLKLNSIPKQMGNSVSRQSRQIITSNPPDFSSDLVSSQTQSPTPTAAPITETKGGTMLEAIKRKTESLKSMLKLRKSSTRKNN